MSAAPPPPPVLLDGAGGDTITDVSGDPLDRRSFVLAATGLGASLLIAVLSILPAPFAIGGPGPTFDTLSEVEGVPLVEIEGAPTFPASGELRLTTVSVARGSSSAFTLGRVLRGWADEARYVVPEEEVFGTPDEEEVFEEQSAQAWITSQESATVAALEALDQPVPAELEVAEVIPTSLATGLLEPGDVIVALNGQDVPTFSALADVLADVTPGDDVSVSYVRGGQTAEVAFATLDDGAGGALMGLGIDPGFELPIDVSVQIDSVGGPSAGLMFSLAIMDMLTEADELADARVAGTGTIDASGDVGAIGGIAMKMHGAVDAGADYFLAPADNCGEVIGNVPAGLDVYSVETLDDAYAAIIGIGSGDTDSLQSCRSP
ncbi:YlbL family protein [Demequina muriae]|uniref:PDZ domain-containing protein n=1 Tax=Demequina muriae TaxID=3051664 RepID=A0ABT8GHS8_9MICO|nr:S16 family serine protease [Demequina sp. EGI L300058]MDN4480988.1 PDZ domain-containing protein [Demequina sp. EGI L300058]